MAFIFEGRNYQFKRLPFGLVNSVAVFVKCMDEILGQNTLQFTTVYVDDLLVTSNNWEEHCNRVAQVLKKLDENNITLKLEKSKLIADEVQFLGFNLSETGITPSQEKNGSYTALSYTQKQETVAIVSWHLQLLQKISE